MQSQGEKEDVQREQAEDCDSGNVKQNGRRDTEDRKGWESDRV